MNSFKELFMPSQATIDHVLGKWSKRKLWTLRVVILVFLLLWFGLGYYLHVQAEQSRARVEQKRIEASRREETARRQAAYQQTVEQYKKSSRTSSQMYGQ